MFLYDFMLDLVIEEWKLFLFGAVALVLYFHYTSNFTFFKEKGVKFMQPSILLGNLGPRLLLKKSFHDFQKEIYEHFRGEKFGGFFEGRRPVMILRDPDILKAVLIKDFEYFVDRNTMQTREPKYLSRSLLNLKGTEWKAVRSIMTPSFSSSRLRGMIPLIENCCQQMIKLLTKHDNSNVEMKDFMGHFTLEVIGTCAFGIECDALTNEDSKFVKVAGNFASMSKPKRALVFFLLIFMPSAFRFLRLSFMNKEATEELIHMLKETKASRRKSTSQRRNDFLQLMIEAAEKEKDEFAQNKIDKRCMDEDTIDAQSLLFLIAGFETSSTLLSFAIYVLATKPHIQDKLRDHIFEVCGNNEVSYETLNNLDYLEAVLMETLRLYPPVARADRVCTKEYVLPGTNITLKPGDVVGIPIYGIHMDPQFYPEPTEFKVERFLGDERKNNPSHLYLPFGAGPRNCIGLRFAMISAKMAVVALIKNFKFSACEKTEEHVTFDKRGFLLKAGKGLWVRVNSI